MEYGRDRNVASGTTALVGLIVCSLLAWALVGWAVHRLLTLLTGA